MYHHCDDIVDVMGAADADNVAENLDYMAHNVGSVRRRRTHNLLDCGTVSHILRTKFEMSVDRPLDLGRLLGTKIWGGLGS